MHLSHHQAPFSRRGRTHTGSILTTPLLLCTKLSNWGLRNIVPGPSALPNATDRRNRTACETQIMICAGDKLHQVDKTAHVPLALKIVKNCMVNNRMNTALGHCSAMPAAAAVVASHPTTCLRPPCALPQLAETSIYPAVNRPPHRYTSLRNSNPRTTASLALMNTRLEILLAIWIGSAALLSCRLITPSLPSVSASHTFRRMLLEASVRWAAAQTLRALHHEHLTTIAVLMHRGAGWMICTAAF